MRRILVTGANKGIGLAIATAILEEHADTYVLLGARSAERGREAVAALQKNQADGRSRVEWLELDVASDESVERAAATVAQRFGRKPPPLYGLVNNAGIGSNEIRATVNVNVLGVRRVCDAFLPLLAPEGRIVNITSAAGPNFVGACSPERQRTFVDPAIRWPELQALIDECIAIEGGKEAFEAKGLGDGNAYGFSKACANSYTMLLAREHPKLRINACTPGFIETDMTRHFAVSQGKTPAELGMKSPSAGARSAMFLLFGDPPGNGCYYGSDARRSPLDRYRAPGDPPYTGE